jgi:hypothetical protein
MSTTNPVAGNQYFTRIQNSAKRFTDLDTTNLQAVDGSVLSLTSNAWLASGYRAHTILAVTPADFSTASIAEVNTLVDPTTGSNVTLPAGAKVVEVVVHPVVAVAGGTTFDIGTGTLNAALTNTYLDNATLTNVNAGVAWVPVPVAAGVPTGTVAASPNNYLNILTNTSANTAGKLEVAVTYLTKDY